MSRSSILYIGTRNLPLERDTELQAALNSNLKLIIAAPSDKPYLNYDINHFIKIPFAKNDVAKQLILNYLTTNHLTPNGLVTWGDGFVELVAMLGEILSLPSSSFEAACNVRNKIKTREILSKYNHNLNPKYAEFTNEKSFVKCIEKIGTPCILKPAGSSGGRGIFSIYSPQDGIQVYRQFVEHCDPKNDSAFSFFTEKYLIEEKLEGSEHSLAGIICNKKVYILGIADKKIDYQIPLQYQNTTPSSLSQSIQKKISNIAQDIVPLLGINWCGFHIDFIVKNKEIKILEVGGRLGGECINSHLIPLSVNGLKPYNLLLKTIQGYNIDSLFKEQYNFTHKAGFRHLIPDRVGTLVDIEMEKAKKHPNVQELIQVMQTGDKVYFPRQKYNSYTVGYVVAQCSMDIDINKILNQISNLVEIKTL